MKNKIRMVVCAALSCIAVYSLSVAAQWGAQGQNVVSPTSLATKATFGSYTGKTNLSLTTKLPSTTFNTYSASKLSKTAFNSYTATKLSKSTFNSFTSTPSRRPSYSTYSSNAAVCWKGNGTIGFCQDVVSATGTCTCK